MNRLKYFCLCLFSLIFNLAPGQTAGLEFSFGYATYDMSAMKDLQDQYMQQSGIALNKVDNFSSGTNWGATFVVGVGKFETGVDYRHFSTLGTLTGTDNGYSVSLTHDLTGHSFGIFGKYPVINHSQFKLKAGTVAGLYATVADIFLQYNGSERIIYQSKSLALTPFLEPVYYIKKWTYIGLRGNYSFDFGGALHAKKDNTIKYEDTEGNSVKPNWSGIRAEIFIGFRMNNE